MRFRTFDIDLILTKSNLELCMILRKLISSRKAGDEANRSPFAAN